MTEIRGIIIVASGAIRRQYKAVEEASAKRTALPGFIGSQSTPLLEKDS
jgi:hypothetical protein